MHETSDPSFVTPRRERLLSPWHLLFVAAVALLALVVLVPSSQTLETTFSRPDHLSLQYMRLLAAVRPNDVGAQLHLARALIALNQWEEANRLLASLHIDDPKMQLWLQRLRLQAHVAQYTADPSRAANDPQLRQVLGQEVATLIAGPLSADELSGLAASSLSINRPDLAARIHEQLAKIDPRQRIEWLREAAKHLLASEQPAAAAAIYDELAQNEKDANIARQYALQAINALTSADQGKQALAMAQRYVERFKDDVEILEAAAKLALANGQPDAAWRHYDRLIELTHDDAARRRFAKLSLLAMTAADRPREALPAVQRYMQVLPKDPDLLGMGVQLAMANKELRLAQKWGRTLLQTDPSKARIANQISIELAVGDVASALELARRLVARQPGNVKARERLAQLAEWNGRPREALREWTYLALHTDSQKFFDHALKMAPQLYEQELLAKLLARRAERGRMTNAQLLALVQVWEDIGEPEELVKILDSYLERYADHQEAWQALAQVHERRGDLPAAVSTWERTSRDFGSSTKEITHRAELMWEMGKTEEAYVLLRDALDHAGAATTHDLLSRSELAMMPQSAAAKTKDNEDTQKKFLSMLGQLFWFSEPRPESLDEYRTLWRQGALISESAERYILLAKTQGRIEEAIQIAEAAFDRFKNPEFLISAMELAYNNGRWDDLERIIGTAHKHAEMFASNKYYYLMLAEYYIHRHDYDRAQQVYLRIIALDPSAVGARANLLWLLIDHAGDRDLNRGKRHRRLLANLLTNWRELAKNQPALWLPFATGWALLGRDKDAVSWYGREWTERPNDHLWLVGYVSNLEALSRSSDAHRLRRFALTQLRPEALRAAHAAASGGEREVLRAYVELVRDVYGAGKGSRWMRQVLHKDLDQPVQKGLHALWRNDGDGGESTYWVQDSTTVARQNPWGRFPKPPKPGQAQRQATVADAGSAPNSESHPAENEIEPAPAPLLVLAPDVSAGEEEVPANQVSASVETGVQSINDLLIFATALAARYAHGSWSIGGRVGVNHLFLDGTGDPQSASTDVELAAYGQYRHSLGRLEIGIGGNLRADASLPQAWASETFNLWRGGVLTLGVHVNELPFDTRWLRLYAARHHATVGLSTSFLTDGLLNIQGNFYQYHTRTNEEIGAGFNAEADLGYRIKRVRPLWTVRVSGSFTRNFILADGMPQFGGDSTSAMSLLDALPTEFAAVGFGTHIEHRFPGVAPIGAGRWRYMADAWVGWMWPMNIVGFEVRGGVGLALPHKQELSLSGFIANNRWLGPGVVNAGLSLRYLFR